jgi:hypothetical protein
MENGFPSYRWDIYTEPIIPSVLGHRLHGEPCSFAIREFSRQSTLARKLQIPRGMGVALRML